MSDIEENKEQLVKEKEEDLQTKSTPETTIESLKNSLNLILKEEYKAEKKRLDDGFEKALESFYKVGKLFILPIVFLLIISLVAVFKSNMSKFDTDIINTALTNITIICVIFGILISILALTKFYFYFRLSNQIDKNKRLLYANSICSFLKEESQQKAHIKLIESLMEVDIDDKEKSNSTATAEIKIIVDKSSITTQTEN